MKTVREIQPVEVVSNYSDVAFDINVKGFYAPLVLRAKCPMCRQPPAHPRYFR